MRSQARVSQDICQEYDPNNYLLMHAMGPNVAVIGSALAAGYFLAMLKQATSPFPSFP
jgi:oxaloacetate decarboxylase beta subunit